MIKNTGSQNIGAQMTTAADGTIFAGAVTVYVTGDAGTQALGSVGSGVCTSEGNGYYTYAPAQAETNYALIAFTFIGTGAISATVQVFTQIVQQTEDNDTKISTLITGVDLNADAIKAVSYDESTAFPLTAVNGSTLTEAGGTGDQLTAINLPNQTMDIFGDITGNLSGSVGSVTAAVTTDAASRTASQATGFATETKQDLMQTDMDTLVDDQTLPKAEYVVVGDTIAGVTLVDTVTNLTNAATNGDLTAVMKASVNTEVDNGLNTAIPGSPTATSINDYVLLSKYALCNRWDITEASGDLDVYDDTNTLYQATAAAFTTLAGVTLRKKIL